MNLEQKYICFTEALSPKLCKDIVDFGNQKTLQEAKTGDSPQNFDNLSEEQKQDCYKIRKSKIVWIDDYWVHKNIMPFIQEANKMANWNFDICAKETPQWTRYGKTEHYTWHQDSHHTPYNDPRSELHGLVRKLSVTVSLVDGQDYQGGDLEFDFRDGTSSSNGNANVVTEKNARKKGSITVFPSFIWHRVSPVTKGTRYSLVIWTCGLPFK
tara:strand:- start:350 stop:985 length:636 start_codon:yes stop_codon:yes gene_type:complete